MTSGIPAAPEPEAVGYDTSVSFDKVRHPTPGETVVATSPALVSWGGKGGNQAAAAAAFSAAVTMVGKAGDDQQGRQLLTDLAARGVDGSGVIVASGARAGGATIAVDGDGEKSHLVDPGANSLLSPREVETRRTTRRRGSDRATGDSAAHGGRSDERRGRRDRAAEPGARASDYVARGAPRRGRRAGTEPGRASQAG
jgi:hypothetical protein